MPRSYTQLAADGTAMQRNIAKNIDRAFKQSAGTTQTHFKSSFRKQGYVDGASKWQKRSKYNTDKGRATLVKSGDLRRSIIARNAGNSIIVSSDKPYAEIHNEGGTIIQKPTFRQRMYFSHLSTQAFADGDKAKGNFFAALSRAKQLTIPIPQRQFMAIPGTKPSKELLDKIYIIFKKQLEASLPR